MDDLAAFLRTQLAEAEIRAGQLFAYAEQHIQQLKDVRLLGRTIPGWHDWPDVKRMCTEQLAEITAKRARLDWLAGLKHDMPEGFPTYDSCRINAKPGELGDLDVGYCSCGLDGMREKILRYDAQPYAGQPGWQEQWRISQEER